MVLTTLLKLVQQAPKGLFPSAVRPPHSMQVLFISRVLTRPLSPPLLALADKQTLVALAPTLGPFFHLSHPSRGSMPGPFTKLSPGVQARALDLVALLAGLDGGNGEATKPLREAVGRAVRTKGVDLGARARWEVLGL